MNPQLLATDVLVIGLGPAGAAAACAACVGGLSVIAVERRRQIGVPVQCAEFIPQPLGAYAQGEGVILHNITGMKSVLPSGTVTHSAFPGLMIDRAAFDQALAAQAQQMGAQLLLESSLQTLNFEAKMALVQTPQGMQQVRYRLLIAADGPHSTVAAALGLPELDVVYTRQYTVPLRRPYADTDILLSNDYPGGYGWLFPKGDLANLGLGLDKQYAADLKKPLDTLHLQLQADGLVGSQITARTGGAIPVGGLREYLHAGHTLFVGDAAGLTHPITGAGIPAAVISGERAGQAAVDFLQLGKTRALQDYEEDIRDQFEASIMRAVARRQWMAQYWNTEAAKADALHRRGWIAFSEYFDV